MIPSSPDGHYYYCRCCCRWSKYKGLSHWPSKTTLLPLPLLVNVDWHRLPPTTCVLVLLIVVPTRLFIEVDDNDVDLHVCICCCCPWQLLLLPPLPATNHSLSADCRPWRFGKFVDMLFLTLALTPRTSRLKQSWCLQLHCCHSFIIAADIITRRFIHIITCHMVVYW